MDRVGRGRIVLGGLLFSLALVIASAPAALAVWLAPETVSPAGRDARSPQVAMDADGDAVMVWTRSDGTTFRIQTRARAADGTLSPVQTLSAAGQDAFDPQVAVEADGDAVFVWRRFDGTNQRIQARARTAMGTPQNISPVGQDAEVPHVAVDGDGDAVIVWESQVPQDGDVFWRVHARTRMATGTLGMGGTVSPAGASARQSQVAFKSDDIAMIVWTLDDGSNPFIEAVTRFEGGTLGPTEPLSQFGFFESAHPQLGIDGDGDAVFVWERFDGNNNVWRIQARVWMATGNMSAIQNLSAPLENAFNPQVAVEADGDAVAVWRRSNATDDRIQARRRAAGGSLGAIQTLSAAGQLAFNPQVAVDAAGAAVAVWRLSDGTDEQIQARRRTVTGTLGGVQTLSPAAQDSFEPEVAIDPDGDAVAVWKLFDGTYDEIQASAGP